MSKNIGRNSSAQDNFIGPNPVTSLTATNVPTDRPFNDGRIDLSWTNPTTGNTPGGYKVFRGGTEIATVAHPSNTYSNTGLASNTLYSYTVTAYDAYGSSTTSNTASATATTVPATMSQPSATAGVNLDTISWTAPSDGGSGIIDYYIESNESPVKPKTVTQSGSGSTTIANEPNTTQAYRVRARNANGSGGFSIYSGNVTTQAPDFFGPPSFFAPPGFFGPPSFFGPPGFFGPPAFFGPPGFGKSVGVNTLIRTPDGLVTSGQLEIGDQVLALSIPGIPDDFREINSDNQFGIYSDYIFSEENLANAVETTATVVGKELHTSDGAVAINGDVYSTAHWLLIKRNGEIKTVNVTDVFETDLIYTYQTKDFSPIETFEINNEISIQVYSINTEPIDFYFTENGLTFDAHAVTGELSGLIGDPDGPGPL